MGAVEASGITWTSSDTTGSATTDDGWWYSKMPTWENCRVEFYPATRCDVESEDSQMRGLFIVYIVDPETDTVLYRTDPFVAKDEDNAQLKAVQGANQAVLGRDIDDLDIITYKLGNVRKKKGVQTVRVVEKK